MISHHDQWGTTYWNGICFISQWKSYSMWIIKDTFAYCSINTISISTSIMLRKCNQNVKYWLHYMHDDKKLHNKYLKIKATRKGLVDWQFFRLYVSRSAMNSVLMANGYLKRCILCRAILYIMRENRARSPENITFDRNVFNSQMNFLIIYGKYNNHICKLITCFFFSTWTNNGFACAFIDIV